MNEIGEKFLPIGTVVLLKGGKKRLMITGYCPMGNGEKAGMVYDYAGCIYPEGMIFAENIAAFNHEQIETVYQKGLIDEEFNTFHEKLKQVYNAMSLVSMQAPDSVLNTNNSGNNQPNNNE